MRLTLLFFIILQYGFAIAQCPVQNIVFNSQAMIDSFPVKYPNCKNLGPIGFSIRESEPGNITSLLPFQQLSGAQECELFIIANKNLTSLAGLNNIDSIKNSLFIQHNAINDISALSNLKYCRWGLTIQEDSLVNLAGLENLNFAFQVSLISNHTEKISLKYLSGLKKATNLFLTGNYQFENISIQSLRNLRISANQFLENLENIRVDSIDELFIKSVRDISFEGKNKPGEIKKVLIEGNGTDFLSFKGIETYDKLQNLLIFDFKGFGYTSRLQNVNIQEQLHLENIKLYPPDFISCLQSAESLNVFGFVNLDSLFSLNGMEKFDKISGLRLSGNKNLRDVEALSNAHASGILKNVYMPNKAYNLMINDNPLINYCHITPICEIIKEAQASKVFISQNGDLCDDKQIVENQCLETGSNEIETKNSLNFYPNPVSTGEKINVATSERIISWSIWDLDSNPVCIYNDGEIVIPYEIIQGLYLLKVKTENSTNAYKIYIY